MGKLDDTFNLPNSISSDEIEQVRKTLAEQNNKMEKNAEASDELTQELSPIAQLAFAEIEEREQRVSSIIDLKQFDSDNDEIFQESMQAFRDAFTIAKDVPAGSAGKIFEAAANFAKIALDAKSSKIKIRLDAIDIALKKRRLDMADANKPDAEPINGESKFMDRNELLKSLKEDLAKHDDKK